MIKVFLLEANDGVHYTGVSRYLDIMSESLSNIDKLQISRITLDTKYRGRIQYMVKGPYKHWKLSYPDVLLSNQDIVYVKGYAAALKEEIPDLKYSEGDNLVLHVHTLNLIFLAVELKALIGKNAFLVMHVHCIPWRDYINYDEKIFNDIYEKVIQGYDYRNIENVLQQSFEPEAYTLPDKIICLSRDGVNHIKKTDSLLLKKVETIPNGIKDEKNNWHNKSKKRKFENLLFVGSPTRAKGLKCFCDALSTMEDKKDFVVNVAGVCSEGTQIYFKHRYPTLNISFHGLLNQAQLSKLYDSCDCGIIMSFHEQSSFAAIEMMAHMIPIITTDVAGLNEMFVDGYNAMLVDIAFDVKRGLSINGERVRECLKRLKCDILLRRTIAQNAYRTYKERYTLQQCVNKTVELYKSL